jgi:trehalose utilization protein
MRVVVFNEGFHERTEPEVARRYPDGIGGAVASAVAEHAGAGTTALAVTQDEPGYGEAALGADVLVWWGHARHHEVPDELAAALRDRVLAGMGLVVLHSGMGSKLFKALMGTSCALRWRHGDDRHLVWTVQPGHPIAAGVPHPIVLAADEMYSEPFDVPPPDELVFISSFSGGEVLRSGACWTRGSGRIFFFGPGDQGYPVYQHPEVRRVIGNAVRWAAPTGPVGSRHVEAESPVGWWQS